MNDNGNKKIDEMEEVLREADPDTTIGKWALKGVVSESGMSLGYLKRRIDALWKDRKDEETRKSIKNGIWFIRRLRPVFETSTNILAGNYVKGDTP